MVESLNLGLGGNSSKKATGKATLSASVEAMLKAFEASLVHMMN